MPASSPQQNSRDGRTSTTSWDMTLIALIVGDAGMPDDLDLLCELLINWVRAGVMTAEEAACLGAQAPLPWFGVTVSLERR
jgi:hypothetical protein